ncbi:MAG: NADPH-dependent assimilatory sulfite reductase hemoprotein subunit [Methylacidiphilales bacterium]|nr:NADPH-dependent assimilatory sulfite reductase hemoprotein subunit [Candidatus Methylacidiphilales bacterium]
MATKSVEEIKEQSHSLRGKLAETLQSGVTHFEEEEAQLIKLHGSYQEDDRDLRVERKRAGLDKAWQFMVRSKIPGGELSSEQYLVHDRMADELANGTLRLTTRQGIQLYGILIGNLKAVIQRINKSGLTTWGACGDVVRNTMSTAIPFSNPVFRDAQKLSEEISRAFFPKSTAYSEIWLDGKKLEDGKEDVEEPIYGRHYLPRKFKIGIAIPPYNDIDFLSQDIALIPHFPKGEVEGYTLYVGGGFGMSHGQTLTRPFLAQPLFYVKREHVIDACAAVVTTQRDHGRRDDRKQARLKYLVNSKGIEWFRKEVESRLKAAVEKPRIEHFDSVEDLLGWREQGDGKWFRGIWIAEGRIKDTPENGIRKALRKICETFKPRLHITPNCNLYLCDLEAKDKAGIDAILREFHVPEIESMSKALLMSHACVALPTCGLALAESERVFPQIMDGIDKILRELGLQQEPILFRMSGCPNGCSRPYNADFSFVGRAPGKYAFYVGGSHRGDHLAGLQEKVVAQEEIPSKVRPILENFVKNRTPSEKFSDYWHRTQINGETPSADQFHVELAERAARLAGQKVEAQG